MDVDAMKPGIDFSAQLDEQVARCAIVLAVIGPNWLNARDENGNRRIDNPGDWVRTELSSALKRDIPVVPVILDGARLPRESELPDDLKPLARRHAVDLRHARFGPDSDAIIAAARSTIPASRRPARIAAALAIGVLGAGAVAAWMALGGWQSEWPSSTEAETTIPGVERSIPEQAAVAEREAAAEAARKAEEKARAAADQRAREEAARLAAEADAKRRTEEAARAEAAAEQRRRDEVARNAAEAEAKRSSEEAAKTRPAKPARPGTLGVKAADLSEEQRTGLGVTAGVDVSEVHAGSAAAKAGLVAGDVILAVDGTPIRDRLHLRSIIASRSENTKVRLDVLRFPAATPAPGDAGNAAANPSSAPPTGELLKQLPSDHPFYEFFKNLPAGTSSASGRRTEVLEATLGGRSPTAEDLGIMLGPPVERDGKVIGVAIDTVAHVSDAAAKGLKPGHTILKVGEVPVTSEADVNAALEHLQQLERNAALLFVEAGQNLFIALKWMGTVEWSDDDLKQSRINPDWPCRKLAKAHAASCYSDAAKSLRETGNASATRIRDVIWRAADLDHAPAAFELAGMLDKGTGGSTDPELAAKYLLRSSVGPSQGENDAQRALKGDMSGWSEAAVKALQRLLKSSGHYSGPDDGKWGSASQKAAEGYISARGASK